MIPGPVPCQAHPAEVYPVAKLFFQCMVNGFLVMLLTKVEIYFRYDKPVLQSLQRESELVFLMPDGRLVSPKKLRAYLKSLCKQCGFENPQQYKLHTFRHFFASYCAQQNLSYKYILEWMGHSSSAILDMYFTMNDRQARRAMNSLSFNSEKLENRTVIGQSGPHFSQTLSQSTHS